MYCKPSSDMVGPAIAFAQAAAAKSMNIAVTALYRGGLWLPSENARKVSKWLFAFLGHYANLASLSISRKKARFPVYPKLHMVCHAALELKRCAERSPWVLSPLAFACQQEEDFIGKPSQVSRNSNPRQTHRNVLWRSMIKVQLSLQQAAKDQRAMDAYPDL